MLHVGMHLYLHHGLWFCGTEVGKDGKEWEGIAGGGRGRGKGLNREDNLQATRTYWGFAPLLIFSSRS